MKTIKDKILTNNIDEIVIVVNEANHDFVDKYYHSQNKIMFESEKSNWKKIIKMFDFKNKSILEIGTGTGFLPIIFIENKVPFKKYTCY